MASRKFGRYEIQGEIGRGGMATVYHAFDPRFEREVAIKVLPREMLRDVQSRIRFDREAKTIALLEHPAIVPVHDFGEEDGQPYFVMRYMTGGSLSDKMRKGAITVQEAAHILTHIAPALDEAHNKGIIHRDLKPGNILFDQFNEPYISDFGIAKLSEAQTNVTGSAIIGTPAYMSPEQAQGETIDGRSDIYALGVILFEMLTGQQPYHGDTPMSVVLKQIINPVPHILDIKPDLPHDIDFIIEKSMAKNREERYHNVKSLANALNAVARGEQTSPGISDSTQVTTSKTVAAVQPPIQPPPLPPAEPVSQPPAKPATLPPAEPVSQPPAKPTTLPPAEPVSQPPAKPATLPPAEPVSQPPVEPVSQPPVVPPSQPPAELPSLHPAEPSSHFPEGTVISKPPQVHQVLEQIQGPAAPRKNARLWIGLGAGILLLCVAVGLGLFFLRNKIPFMAAYFATETQPVIQASPTATIPAATPTIHVVILPVASPTPAPTEAPSHEATFKINANVRSGPGTVYPVLAVQTAGTRVLIEGRNHTGDWLAFKLPGEKMGWVAASSLQVDFEVNTLAEFQAPPVPTAAPLPTATPVSGGGGSPSTPLPPTPLPP